MATRVGIRNIGIIAHIDAGKTTTSERLLFYTGKTHRMGGVDQGTAVMDWMEQEQNRGITITSAATSITWMNTLINLIDTPGHVDFTIEVERSLKVLDGAVGVFCAVGGVEPQSETVWHQSEKYHVKKIAYINKMDRLGADFYRVLDDIEKKLNITPIPLFLPIGAEKQFEGLIDLLTQTELHWEEASEGSKYESKEVREEYKSLSQKYYNNILEKVGNFSEEVAELYLEEKEVPQELLVSAIQKGVLESNILPVFCGASLKNIGIQCLLNGIIQYLPNPNQVPLPPIHDKDSYEITKWNDETRSLAYVFKTEVHKDYGLMLFIRMYRGSLSQNSGLININTGKKERVLRILKMHSHKTEQAETIYDGEIAVLIGPRFTRTGHTLSNTLKPELVLEPIQSPDPVITTSIEVNTLSDRDKLLEILEKIEIEDPSFQYKEDEHTGQILISGMGELHLEVITTRIRDDYQISVRQGTPQVNYRESISQTFTEKYTLSEHSHAFHTNKNMDIQIELMVSPAMQGEGICIQHDKINIARNSDERHAGFAESWWIQECIEAIHDSSTTGIVLGYPVIDIMIEIQSIKIIGDLLRGDQVLKFAISQAYHNALKQAHPIKLEPIMKLVVTVPQDFVGDALNTISARKGIVHEVQNNGVNDIVTAHAPLSMMFGYSTSLRNATQGRALFSLEFSHFSEVT